MIIDIERDLAYRVEDENSVVGEIELPAILFRVSQALFAALALIYFKAQIFVNLPESSNIVPQFQWIAGKPLVFQSILHNEQIVLKDGVRIKNVGVRSFYFGKSDQGLCGGRSIGNE